ALNGKNMSDFKDPEGKYIFREFLKVCQNNGEGFVDYMWPKPGFDNPVAKLSYVKLFKEWGWIVGTGIYLDDVDRIVAEKQAQIRSQLAVQRNWIIGIMMAILLVTGAVVLITTRRIATSITSASIMLKDIAQGEGDLTRTLKVQSNDEVGEMAGWFNLFVKKIRDLVAEVKDKTLHLDESSQDLSGISEHMSTGTDQTSAKANKVSEAAGTMSANVTSMAATMQEASSNITMVAAAVEQMTSTINEIAHNTGKASTITGDAVHQAGQASQQVSELGAAAQKIGKVVEAITEISEQVNLLALNATIEAARAGEAGKGFAVVANEIKDLARQTAEATGEIKQKVIDIQSSTKGTVTQISAITEVVHQVDEIVSTISAAVEEQSVATKEIAINITQASEGIGDVSNKVTENSEFSSSIAQEILEVTRATGEMASNSSQVNNQAGELAGLSHTLNTIVGQFKV
ncbi:MAG: HAMP domain-containing protein, partial [Desulfobacteraceae bacterium]|nr:HAMP domain-containing protein [Desulfobacteraceae bacterium]